jgi:nitrite reductase/ring-hydroxylating ferredoxin subunit
MARPQNPQLLKVASVDELKDGQSKKFNVKRGELVTEAFLIRFNGGYFAYLNLCRHWTVGLDFDDNDFFSEDKKWLVCKNHGAVYHPETGQCAGGPCNGAGLYQVPLAERKGNLYADIKGIDWGITE